MAPKLNIPEADNTGRPMDWMAQYEGVPGLEG